MKTFVSDIPLLSQEWDVSNLPLTPSTTTHKSGLKVKWVCSTCEHRWSAQVGSRSNGRGCPACSGQVPKVGITDLAHTEPEIALEWDPSNELKASEVTRSSHRSVGWVCRKCQHSWQAMVHNRVKGTGCPRCTGQVVTAGINDLNTTDPYLAEEWDPGNILGPDEVTKTSSRIVWWLCRKCGHRWEYMIQSRSRQGCGCPNCKSPKSKIEIRLCELLGAKHDSSIPLKWGNGNKYKVDGLLPNKVVIEYDGYYYHKVLQDRTEKDIEKTSKMIEAGYTVVRVREGKLQHLPPAKGLIQVSHDFGKDPVEDTAQEILGTIAQMPTTT